MRQIDAGIDHRRDDARVSQRSFPRLFHTDDPQVVLLGVSGIDGYRRDPGPVVWLRKLDARISLQSPNRVDLRAGRCPQEMEVEMSVGPHVHKSVVSQDGSPTRNARRGPVLHDDVPRDAIGLQNEEPARRRWLSLNRRGDSFVNESAREQSDDGDDEEGPAHGESTGTGGVVFVAGDVAADAATAVVDVGVALGVDGRVDVAPAVDVGVTLGEFVAVTAALDVAVAVALGVSVGDSAVVTVATGEVVIVGDGMAVGPTGTTWLRVDADKAEACGQVPAPPPPEPVSSNATL
jgi:hypothetical protein